MNCNASEANSQTEKIHRSHFHSRGKIGDRTRRGLVVSCLRSGQHVMCRCPNFSTIYNAILTAAVQSCCYCETRIPAGSDGSAVASDPAAALRPVPPQIRPAAMTDDRRRPTSPSCRWRSWPPTGRRGVARRPCCPGRTSTFRA